MKASEDIRSIREAVNAMAATQPMAPFLISPESGTTLLFRDLKERSILLAETLRRAGLKAGDKVAFLMDNGLLTAQLFLGTMYGGYVAVPLNVRAGAMQLAYMLDHCDAKVVFVEDQYAGMLGEILEGVHRDMRVIAANPDGPLPAPGADFEGEMSPAPAGDDVAMLMYSSGSTGKPKAAIHTHSSILAHGRNSIEAHQLRATDRSLLVLPIYHINAECVTLIPTLLSGGAVVVARRFAVSQFWDWIEDFEITWSALVPTIVSELVNWDDPAKDRGQAAYGRIRFFRSSSAPLSPSLHRQFLDKFHLPLLQAMGSTEGGNVFSNPQPPGKNKIGSPGLPWGFEARIVDRQGADVAPGESGEVLLRGDALMQGYYKDSEGTAAVVDGDGWLHTGDLARRDEDGYFFIVGRSKELIIKGGVNIAPRQIDEVLESHPAVLEAAAVGVPDRYFGEDALAFVVLRPQATAEETELLSFCETRLGQFKTPSRIHFLKELPKGPSGKVQRLRLLDPAVLASVAAIAAPARDAVTIDGDGRRGENPLQASGTLVEQVVAAAWAEVFKVPQVDPQANFFALGGHSLMAIQCLSKLREKLPIVLSLSDFIENSTVAEQAEMIRQRLRSANGRDGAEPPQEEMDWENALLQQYVPPTEDGIPLRASSAPQPLSQAQQRLWFLEQLNPDVPVYNEAEAARLTGELNVDAMEDVFNAIVARHEVLRSTIQVMDGVPHAVIHERWPLRLKKNDLSNLPPARGVAELDRLLIDEPRARYDLEAEPGIRVALVRMNPREHVLILMMHHIICDWSSVGIIWRELSTLYSSFLTGKSAALPALPIGHQDYVAWQQERLAKTSCAEDLAFWEEALSGAPTLLDLPADRTRPASMSYHGGRLRWKLSGGLTEALRNTSREEKTSLFTIFAAALNTLLYRYTGAEDILVGIPLADRDQQELQSLLGFLLHTHVLRTRLTGDMTFRDLLVSTQKNVLDLFAHRSAPFDQIVGKLQPERNLSFSPLFQVMLNWRDRDQLLSFIGMEGLAVESLMAHSDTSKFDLLVFATDCGDEIELQLEYNRDLFDADRVLRLLGHLQTLLEAAVVDPNQSITAMPMLTPGELQQVTVEWNRTHAEFPANQCVHQLFEEQAARTPNATAVVFEGISLSYVELNRRANRMARRLRDLGVKPDARVAICVERGLEMVVSLLATLKSGGAYVPLDPSYPPERLRFMLEDAAPLALLTQSHLRGLFTGLDRSAPVLDLTEMSLDDSSRSAADSNLHDLDPELMGLNSRHLAYVIYTSGSTGKPKGVMVEHRSVVNRLVWMQRTFHLSPDEAVLQKTPFGFDVSVWEFFWTLMAGAKLVMAQPEGHKNPSYMTAAIHKNDVTTLHFVPSMLQAFLEHGDLTAASPLVRVVCSGEALSATLVRRFQQQMPNVALHNLYGPTEAAVDVTAWTCPADFAGPVVPIGKPISNTRMYILDVYRQPVPAGIPGELYIGGVQVARGYLNRPQLTEERFVADPFTTDPDARMYRTGDLARWMVDGNIEYLGRNDFQVKIRGFRIELGEIEAALTQHPAIDQCVVIVRGENLQEKYLAAYIVLVDGQIAPRIEELREILKQRLPEYMVPSAFVPLIELPLTPNGKVDRKELSRLDGPRTEYGHRTSAPPKTLLEFQLKTIWERVLGVQVAGVQDDFFDLGGHSLLALRLISEVNGALKSTITIPAFVRHPTIEGMAGVLQQQSASILEPKLIPLRAGNQPGAVFLLSPEVSVCRLAYAVEGGTAVYAATVPLVASGSQAPTLPGRKTPTSLFDLAKAYVQILRQCPHFGPCVLVGYSFTGLLAVEIARQLHSEGWPVDAVFILDTYACNRTLKHKWKTFSLGLVKASIQNRVGRLLMRLPSIRAKFSRIWRRKPTVGAEASVETIYQSMPEMPWQILMKLVARGMKGYRLLPLDVRGVVFRASERRAGRPQAIERDLGWGGIFLGALQVVDVGGDHESMLNDPHLAALGRRFRECVAAVTAHSQTGASSSNPEEIGALTQSQGVGD